MSSRPSTPSEGEILESDSEKATQTLPSTNGKPVDRPSRTRLQASKSPSESPLRSPPPARRPLSRSKSRSPYREPARGAKRERETDHYRREESSDPRRLRAHYDQRTSNPDRRYDRDRYDNSRRGDRGSYGDRSAQRGDDRYWRGSGRSKPRSRSPPYRPSDRDRRPGPYDRRRETARGEGHAQRSRESSIQRESKGLHSREQSVSDRGHPPVAPASRRQNAETADNQTLQRDTFKHGQSNAADKASDRDIPMDDADASTAPANPQSLDEAAIIEARRKRREAIKAKYKGQEPSMLVQALEIKSAAQNLLNLDEKSPTPLIVAENDTPKPASVTTSPPQTPRDMMGQDSPTDIIHGDNDLANDEEHQVPAEAGDGPSAVDYDPTMDMQEDRLRQTHRLNGNDVSSSAYDETVPQKQDVLLPEKPHADTQAPKDEFDMFADAEDMFAELPPPTKLHYDEGDMARAAHIPRGKALDMSMLDDWDDDEGYYKVILGELLDGRYHVQSNLGRGMFSGVVRALDQVNQKQVAIKLIRSNETMKKAGLKEIEILVKLAQADPEDKKHLIRLERYFEHKGHLCMVFENLSINLREVLKKFGRDVGINLKAVRAYAQQMFLGLSLMRKCSILHADLKPDNVLVNESRNMLKICDLGSASDASENEITPYLVSRFYRAPEIMLGMPYDFAIDVWSIGCTLYELYTGKILFTGRNNNQMLRSIMECRGKFNHKLLRKAQFAPIHFDDLLNFRSVERDRLSGKDIVRILPFTKPTRDLRTRLGVNRNQLDEAESKELASFLDLLERCLNLNPEKRCTATEALRHPFILRKF